MWGASVGARRALAAAVTAALLPVACGSDENAGGPDAASGGVAGATGGAAGASGGASGADASTDQTDGDGSDAGAQGCVDIHILHAALPDPEKWSNKPAPFGTLVDRDHIWRDTTGVHVAWNAVPADLSGPELVVSSFDATSGANIAHRFFSPSDRIVFSAASLGTGGVAGLAVNVVPKSGGDIFAALLLIRTDDPTYEKLYPLPPWPDVNTILVGVGWDGEAFAVHGFGDKNVQYVTRLKADGTVVLPPTAFGVTSGYAEEVRYSTDPVEGVTYAVSGRTAPFFPWLTGHMRDGTPTPDAAKIQGIQLQPKNFAPDGGWGGGVYRPTITAVAGGAGVAWSSAGSSQPITTFIQRIGSNLTPTADAIGIAGEPVPPPGQFYDEHEWLVVQPRLTGGWWAAGTNKMAINELTVESGGASLRRKLVTFSNWQQNGFAVTDFESARYGDEVWLGFTDASSAKAQPFRIVRAKPECTYLSMHDVLGQ